MIPNPFDLYPLARDIAFYASAGIILLFCLICLGVEIYRGRKRRRGKQVSKSHNVM